jgi:AraC-like DNA-binding protein
MGDGANATAHIVCGYLGCDARPFNPLLLALPRVISLSGGTGELAALGFALAESKRPRIGSDSVLGRLSELMFVEVSRYVETLPSHRANWLSGLRDATVGAAVAALHADPSRRWSLESLARDAGASRSVLAERFTRFVGQPPLQYLAHWRMQLAANRLRNTSDTVAAVAQQLGYESEVAFSRAFKKIVGLPPSRWRHVRE